MKLRQSGSKIYNLNYINRWPPKKRVAYGIKKNQTDHLMCLNIIKKQDYVEDSRNYISHRNMRNQANEKRREKKFQKRQSAVYRRGNKTIQFFGSVVNQTNMVIAM